MKNELPAAGISGRWTTHFFVVKSRGERSRDIRITNAACTVTHSQDCRTAYGDLRLIGALGGNFPGPVLCIASLSEAML